MPSKGLREVPHPQNIFSTKKYHQLVNINKHYIACGVWHVVFAMVLVLALVLVPPTSPHPPSGAIDRAQEGSPTPKIISIGLGK